MSIPERPCISTPRTTLTILPPEKAGLMLAYALENREHLSQWEPSRGQGFYTLKHWQKQLIENFAKYQDGVCYRFAALNKEGTEVIGLCSFNNVVRGAFQACHLGYSIAGKYQGLGYMYEITQAGIDYIFSEVGLHRVMANYIPGNKRSGNLLARLGFEKEGYARDYLKINGQWQDHILTAKINARY